MKKSEQIQKQINQIQREIQDIKATIPRLEDIQSLIDVQGEVRDREQALQLLRGRLEAAVEAERQEQARKDELAAQRSAVRAGVDRLTSRIDTRRNKLAEFVLAEFAELEKDLLERRELGAEYTNLSYEIRDGKEDALGRDRLVEQFGWSLNGEEASPLNAWLYLLFAERQKLPGSLSQAKEAMGTLAMQQLVAWGNSQTRGEEQDRNRDEMRLREHLNNL